MTEKSLDQQIKEAQAEVATKPADNKQMVLEGTDKLAERRPPITCPDELDEMCPDAVWKATSPEHSAEIDKTLGIVRMQIGMTEALMTELADEAEVRGMNLQAYMRSLLEYRHVTVTHTGSELVAITKQNSEGQVGETVWESSKSRPVIANGGRVSMQQVLQWEADEVEQLTKTMHSNSNGTK